MTQASNACLPSLPAAVVLYHVCSIKQLELAHETIAQQIRHCVVCKSLAPLFVRAWSLLLVSTTRGPVHVVERTAQMIQQNYVFVCQMYQSNVHVRMLCAFVSWMRRLVSAQLILAQIYLAQNVSRYNLLEQDPCAIALATHWL
jgi:hypothetical protein